MKIAKRFGLQPTQKIVNRVRASGAHEAGKAAGRTINIPTGCPIGSGGGPKRLEFG